MMKRTGRFDFYQDIEKHITVIMLPYKGNTSMMIVLPDVGKMKEVEDYISSDYIRHWHDSLFRRYQNQEKVSFSSRVWFPTCIYVYIASSRWVFRNCYQTSAG